MKRTVITSLLVLLVSSIASASITPFDDGGAALQGILDNATIGVNSSVDVTTDMLSDAEDSYWEVGATGGSITSVMFTIPNGPGVDFGIYSGGQYVELLDSSAVVGQQVLLSIQANGDVYKNFVSTGVNFDDNEFGYYIGALGVKRHSDIALNDDGIDRMVAYQGMDIDQVQIGPWAPGVWGSGEYVLAWESSDQMQYDDFVVMVESVRPIPEPASMMLLGLGGFVIRKRRG